MKTFLLRAALALLAATPLFAGPTNFPGGARGFDPTYWFWTDEFEGDLIKDEWSALEGTDTSTAAQAISVGILHGVVRLTTGDHASADFAANASEITLGRNVAAQMAGTTGNDNLVFDCRLRINSDITDTAIFVGLTDTVLLEEPASISGTTFTTTADDCVGFLYDSRATTDNWYAVGVDTTVDAMTATTGNTGVAPTASAYNRLTVEITDQGHGRFYIDGGLRASLDNVVAPTVLLSPTAVAMTSSAESHTADIDYITVYGNRE